MQNLARHYGVLDKEQSHRALDDVLLNERVLQCLLRDVKLQGKRAEPWVCVGLHRACLNAMGGLLLGTCSLVCSYNGDSFCC